MHIFMNRIHHALVTEQTRITADADKIRAEAERLRAEEALVVARNNRNASDRHQKKRPSVDHDEDLRITTDADMVWNGMISLSIPIWKARPDGCTDTLLQNIPSFKGPAASGVSKRKMKLITDMNANKNAVFRIWSPVVRKYTQTHHPLFVTSKSSSTVQKSTFHQNACKVLVRSPIKGRYDSGITTR